MRSNIISGQTRICGIIGDPIEHTKSPAIQNTAFQEAGLDYVFVPFKVTKEDLKEAIAGMRALGIRGMNVTIPHKVTVMRFLDEIDPLAGKIGAVNTIVNEEGILKGYNTDASGFLKALLEAGVRPEKKKTVILGAGGASRAIAFILADRGADLVILNRHPETARVMADRIMGLFRKEVKADELTSKNLKTALERADILINTTSVGMYPDDEETPVPSRLLRPGLAIFDIIYNPIKTRLLAEAEKRGAKIISGVEMLVQQGAEGFELWTGQKAPVEKMREAAVRELEREGKSQKEKGKI